MADDQTPDVEQDPEVVAAEAVEARAHAAVESARSDALARAKHARDLAALSALLDGPRTEVNVPSLSVPRIDPEPVADAPAEPVQAPAVDPAPESPEPTAPPPEIAAPEVPTAEPAAVEPEPAVVETVAETMHGNVSEGTLASDSPAQPPTPEPAPPGPVAQEPAPPPPEPRSRRAPFASGRTKPGPRTFDAASGAVVSRPLHEWLRVRADLTDAEAADGEAGGPRLQALVAAHGADAVWAPARPAS